MKQRWLEVICILLVMMLVLTSVSYWQQLQRNRRLEYHNGELETENEICNGQVYNLENRIKKGEASQPTE